MNIVELWERNKKRIYLSYVAIAIVVFGLFIYLFYKGTLQSLWFCLFGFILLVDIRELIKELIDNCEEKEKRMFFTFPFCGLMILALYDVKHNILLIPLSFFIYLYLMLPSFVEYKEQEDIKTVVEILEYLTFFSLIMFFNLIDLNNTIYIVFACLIIVIFILFEHFLSTQ